MAHTHDRLIVSNDAEVFLVFKSSRPSQSCQSIHLKSPRELGDYLHVKVLLAGQIQYLYLD